MEGKTMADMYASVDFDAAINRMIGNDDSDSGSDDSDSE